MAYEKTEWKNGDTITAEKLNHMEDGISDGGGGMEPLIVQMSWDDEKSITKGDKTFGEIRTAFENGQMVYIKWWNEDNDRIGNDLDMIVRIHYEIYNDSCSVSVTNGSGSSVVSVETYKDGLPIATLEELDESYIYVSD